MMRSLTLLILTTLLTAVRADDDDTLSFDDYNPTGFGKTTAGSKPTKTIAFPWPFPSSPGPVSSPVLVGTPIATISAMSSPFGPTTVYAVPQCVTFAGDDGEQCPDDDQDAIRDNSRQTSAAVFQVSVATESSNTAMTAPNPAMWYGARFAFPDAPTPVWGRAYCSYAPTIMPSPATTSSGGSLGAKETASSSSVGNSSRVESAGKCQYSVSIETDSTLGSWGNWDVVPEAISPEDFMYLNETVWASMAIVKEEQSGATMGKTAPVATTVAGVVGLCAVLGLVMM